MTDLARKLADQGHTRAAAALFLQQFRADPHDFTALVNYAHAAANHDRPAVIAVIAEYLVEHAADPVALSKGLALQLPYLESEARRTRGLNEYSAGDVDEPPFQFSQGTVARWIEACEARLVVDDNRFAAYSALAWVDHALRDYAAADDNLAKARDYPGDPRISAAHFTGPWFDDIERAISDNMKPAATLKAASVRTARRVYVGCDEKYFNEYGVILARSLAGQDLCAHFHVYDMAEPNAVMDRLYSLFRMNFALTTERTSFTDIEQAKHYYASARLIRMAQQMEMDNIPTVMLDADLMLGGSLGRLFERLDNADIILCRMPGRIPFHTQFNASVVGINPRGGRRYLKRVAGFIAKSYLDRRVPWCLDQIALLCTLREMQSRGQGPRSAACGPFVYDGSMSPKTALWPQKLTVDNPEHGLCEKARSGFSA